MWARQPLWTHTADIILKKVDALPQLNWKGVPYLFTEDGPRNTRRSPSPTKREGFAGYAQKMQSCKEKAWKFTSFSKTALHNFSPKLQ